MEIQKEAKHRTLTGVVVSDKMSKTVVVRVDRLKQHPKYKRRYRVSKKYKAHDEKGEFHVGDKVRMEEVRPISRDKRWQVKEKLGSEKNMSTAGTASGDVSENVS